MFCKKVVFLPRLHDVDIGWPVLHKKDILIGYLFFAQIILPNKKTGSFSNEPGILVP